MQRHFLIKGLMGLLVGGMLLSCGTTGKSTTDSTASASKEVKQWYNQKQWLNGLTLTPHPSINEQELYRQYHLNNKWWDEAFAFLKNNDLQSMKPGTYVIDTGNVIATISEVAPKDKEQVNWEAHRNFNDLQYIISGKAQMGIAPIDDAQKTVTIPYNGKGDTETFSVSGGEKYYVADPTTFFIFSPKDIHRPAFKQEGFDSIKKIVIKVRVPQ